MQVGIKNWEGVKIVRDGLRVAHGRENKDKVKEEKWDSGCKLGGWVCSLDILRIRRIVYDLWSRGVARRKQCIKKINLAVFREWVGREQRRKISCRGIKTSSMKFKAKGLWRWQWEGRRQPIRNPLFSKNMQDLSVTLCSCCFVHFAFWILNAPS